MKASLSHHITHQQIQHLQVRVRCLTMCGMATNRSILTVTTKGQVTFRRSVLDHLGAAPGDHLVVDLMPGGRAEVHVASRGRIDDFIGALVRRDEIPVSIEDMRRIAALGWSGGR